MSEGLSIFVVVLALTVITSVVAKGFDPQMRGWVWLALAEYLVCAGAQLVWAYMIVGGGDGVAYTERGVDLAKFLDVDFSWASGELLSMLLQQQSAFDRLIETPLSNTGSMFAVATFLVFLLRSGLAVHVLIAGLCMFSSLSIFRAFRAVYTEVPPVRLFVATVLFPSVAFWTSALHKESICLIGMGLLFAGWRAAYLRQVRALFYIPTALALIVLFRAPALPPLILGLVVYFVFERLQKARGTDKALLGPVYLAIGLGMMTLAILAASQVMPGLSLDQLSETVTKRQEGWSQSRGGSALDEDGMDAGAPTGLAAQLARVPLGLLNALFRPQFFDVHNLPTFIGAIEMTVLTVLVIQAIRRLGVKGVASRVESAPFLLMCAVVTLVGCTFVGLVTLNLGSLARYRVPFLPFYGTLVMALSAARAKVPAPKPPKARGRTAIGRASAS